MNDRPQDYALDLPWVRRSFDRAARSFDQAAVLHREVRDGLLGRLDLTTLVPGIVVDAGCATAHTARALQRRYPKAKVLAVDSSLEMLRSASRQQTWLNPFARLCADATRLPLKDGSVDLLVSNLMLQWCDPDAAFAEFRRVLAPNGLLTFSTLGPDTLRELRTAWASADSANHVHLFMDMHDLGDALVRAGFASPVLDVERITLRYTDVATVAADLKATGARNATSSRARGLTGRKKFATMQAGYEALRTDGRLTATYEVVFAHAWVPNRPARSSDDGSVVSLEEIKRRLRSVRDGGDAPGKLS